ncbi:MAG: class I SAM-dependent methyltransferase [Pseudobdellovibrionaceae bacterium]
MIQKNPNPAEAIEKYAVHAAGYDQSAARTMSIRIRTIEKLNLSPGDTVLDVACGTGLSFELLQKKVGPSGRIIGVEVSPEMSALAEKRIAKNHWNNVTLITSAIEEAKIPPGVDAILFNYTHDVIRSALALENIFSHAKNNAKVSIAGMKLLPWWLFPGNAYVYWSARPYMTTFEGLGKPWSLAEEFIPNLKKQTTLFGTGYIAWGNYRKKTAGDS